MDGSAKDQWNSGFTGRISCACDSQGQAYLFARREGRLVWTKVQLQGKAAKTPVWDVLDAPFEGPVIPGISQKDGVVALGLDGKGIVWMKTWDGRSWQPEGRNWTKIGTIDDLFEAQSKTERHLDAA